MSPMPSIPSSGGDDFAQRIQAERAKAAGQVPDEAQDAAKQASGEQSRQSQVKERAAASEEQGTGPVGQGDHVVREGECISSIAKDHGRLWKTIWDDPANSELKSVRKSPNLLLPGDRVTIPDQERKDEPIAAEQRHRFVRRGEPSTLKVRFTEWDKARANAEYKAYVDRKFVQEGVLDSDGGVEFSVPSDALKAEFLIYDEDGTEDKRVVWLRQVPPISEISGVEARLHNLGFRCGHGDGSLNATLVQALKAFQHEHDLEVTGKPDEATRKKLQKLHGC